MRTLTDEHKRKIAESNARQRQARLKIILESGPFVLRRFDAENLVVETAAGDPLYYPCTLAGITAALEWIMAQRLCRDADGVRNTLRRISELRSDCAAIARALAKEAGR